MDDDTAYIPPDDQQPSDTQTVTGFDNATLVDLITLRVRWADRPDGEH